MSKVSKSSSGLPAIITDELPEPELVEITTNANEQQPITEAAAVNQAYIWEIPCTIEGYSLRLTVNATSLDEARYLAGEIKIGVDNEERGLKARPLNATEANWIKTVEPAITVESTTISIDYLNALRANERLIAENEGFRKTELLFKSLGIDVNNPRDWVDRMHESASGRIKAAEGERMALIQAQSDAFSKAVDHLKEIQKLMGIAPPPAPDPIKPDYSRLTVVYPNWDTLQHRSELYPDLVEAGAVSREVDSPMDQAEKAGYELVKNAAAEWWREKAGLAQQGEMDAFLRYLTTMMDVK